MKQHVQINAFIKKGKKGRTWNTKENLKNMQKENNEGTSEKNKERRKYKSKDVIQTLIRKGQFKTIIDLIQNTS